MDTWVKKKREKKEEKAHKFQKNKPTSPPRQQPTNPFITQFANKGGSSNTRFLNHDHREESPRCLPPRVTKANPKTSQINHDHTISKTQKKIPTPRARSSPAQRKHARARGKQQTKRKQNEQNS
jgi:hypothetical protein